MATWRPLVQSWEVISVPKYLEDVEMTRVTVRLPAATMNEIDEYILAAGMYRTYFLTAALILGSRTLARVFSPGRFDGAPGRELEQLQRTLQHESVRTNRP